jgi:hypothetical protein
MTPDGYINEIYGGIQCEGDCVEQQAAAGAPILVAPGGTTSGVDIALSRGGRIAGTVADAATSAGIQDAVVYVYDSRNRVVARGISDPAGAFLTSPGLASGIYYAVAAGYGGYLSEIFDNVSCGTSCFSGMAITAGSPIAVTAGTTTTGRHFTLQRGARIRGTIAQEGTGQPLGNASVRIFDDAGRLITSGTSNQDGSYVTELGLPGGVYFASTTNGIGHRDEIFDNQPCADDCASQVTTGTPIRVPDGTAQTVNLALAPATGPPDAPASLRSSNQAGGVLISWTASRGAAATSYRLEAGFAPGMTAVAIPVAGTSYLAAGVRPGVYFVRVRGVNAAGAGPASAEIAIGVGAGGIMTPGAPRFLFAAMTGRRLLLAWDEAGDGGAAVDYIIEAGNAAGAANIALIASDRRAFTFDPLPDGVYFLRVRARTPAGVGPPSNEVMLVVGGVASPPPAVERLGASSSSGTVVLSWLPPPGSVTGYVVEAGSAPGRSDLASALIGPGVSATFSGVPPGKYYVRLRGINAQGRGVASNEILVVVE